MSWYAVAGYSMMIGFFWLAWRGWCEDTRKIKRQARGHREL
jgi:hypothetical protein